MQSDYYRQMNSVTLNNAKATVIFQDSKWELIIEMGNNKASIEGLYNVNPAEDAYDKEEDDEEDDEDAYDDEEDEEDEDAYEDEDCVMLKKHLQEENFTFNMEFMKWYYNWAKRTPTLNRSQKMKAFIDANKDTLMQFEESENENRKMLMMSIFQKKNLEFKDVYMDMYYEWQKNAPKQNRYKKMCSFIQAQGF